jgi:hypothetical protein
MRSNPTPCSLIESICYGRPRRRAGGLRPSSTPLDTPRRTPQVQACSWNPPQRFVHLRRELVAHPIECRLILGVNQFESARAIFKMASHTYATLEGEFRSSGNEAEVVGDELYLRVAGDVSRSSDTKLVNFEI